MNAVALATSDRGIAVEIATEIATEIARAEEALEALIGRSLKLHASNIEHDPIGCLTCFSQR
jgi:hypothetical protein